MNCDEAFDILTDPLRSNDAQLLWHLDMCPRCRQMREVLAPAMELFAEDEDPSAEDSAADTSAMLDYRDRPPRGERPFLSVEAVRVAETAAARLHHGQRQRSTPPPARGRWLQYAAVMLIAFSAALAMHGSGHQEVPAPAESACLWKARVSAQSAKPKSP